LIELHQLLFTIWYRDGERQIKRMAVSL